MGCDIGVIRHWSVCLLHLKELLLCHLFIYVSTAYLETDTYMLPARACKRDCRSSDSKKLVLCTPKIICWPLEQTIGRLFVSWSTKEYLLNEFKVYLKQDDEFSKYQNLVFTAFEVMKRLSPNQTNDCYLFCPY